MKNLKVLITFIGVLFLFSSCKKQENLTIEGNLNLDIVLSSETYHYEKVDLDNSGTVDIIIYLVADHSPGGSALFKISIMGVKDKTYYRYQKIEEQGKTHSIPAMYDDPEKILNQTVTESYICDYLDFCNTGYSQDTSWSFNDWRGQGVKYLALKLNNENGTYVGYIKIQVKGWTRIKLYDYKLKKVD